MRAPLSDVRRLTARLSDPGPGGGELQRLRSTLARVAGAQPGLELRGHQLGFETIEELDAQLAGDQLDEIEPNLQPAAASVAAPLVFRRETGFRSDLLGNSVPDEAVGMAPAETFGPFIDDLGRQVWFDLFRPIALTSISFAGHPAPALRVLMRKPRAGQTSYVLEAGSAWIASDVIARVSALAGYYTGLTVDGGRLELSQPATVSGQNLVLNPATVVTLRLSLAQHATPASDGPAGADGAAADVRLPRTLALRFDLNSSHLDAGDAACTVFGCGTAFSRSTTPPVWIPLLSRILVPFDATTQTRTPHQFRVSRSASSLCTVDGGGAIDPAGTGWLLPVAKVDPLALGAAAGLGALCQTIGPGLSATWTGLRGGKTALPHPAIIAEPGQVAVLDFAAANPEGRQRWELWRNANNPHTSRIDLRFGPAFPFSFVASGPANSEGVFYFCGHRAELDRPVDGNGHPFAIESSIAFAATTQTVDKFHAFLLDTDLLLDGKPATAETFRRHSVVLRNALFTVNRPRGLGLFGELVDGRVTAGLLAMSHDILSYLPTLPDPYVASYTHLLRDRAASALGRPQQALTGFVRWPDRSPLPADAPDPDDPRGLVFYKFSPPMPALAQPLAAQRTFRAGVAGFNRDLAQASRDAASTRLGAANAIRIADDGARETLQRRISAADLRSDAATKAIGNLAADRLLGHVEDKARLVAEVLDASQRATSSAADPGPTANGRDTTFSRRIGFAGDPLMLLDVSTHADLMGVTLGTPFRVTQDDRGDRLVRAAATSPALQSGGDGSDLPLQIMNMDVVAPAPNLRAATLPQVSWEPVLNVPLKGPPDPADTVTTVPGLIVYENDGIPTRIFSQSPHAIPIAPLPVMRHFVGEFNDPQQPQQMLAVFTLPFGILAQAGFNRSLAGPAAKNARVDYNMPHFGQLRGGLQIKAQAPESTQPSKVSPSFVGWSFQLDNIRWGLFGIKLTGSTLGVTVEEIFNRKFRPGGDLPQVPLEAIELSGYGASIFSDWRNAFANTADVSQVLFDVVVGRTAQEVVQVRSIHYPTGAHFVRTVTLMRSNNGYVFRSDSGWKAESDGEYDFSYTLNLQLLGTRLVPNPYEFHKQPVKRVSNIRNIRDFPAAGNFSSSFKLNDPNLPPELKALTLPEWQQLFAGAANLDHTLDVHLQAVLIDCDVHLDNIVGGGSEGRDGETVVQAHDLLGYVQLAPSAIALPERIFADLLRFQNGSLGGPVDCVINIAKSKQTMRVQRVDVNPAVSAAGRTVFVTAAHGSPILPPDGAWSMVTQRTDTGDVKPLSPAASTPLIKPNGAPNYLLAHPADVEVPTSNLHYGVVQSTGTQKLLFDVPQFSPGVAKLKSAQTYFADAYKLLNAKGVFPNVANALGLTAAEREVDILGEGLMRMAERPIDLGALLPSTYEYAFIDEPGVLKIYVQYADTAKSPTNLTLGIDSAAGLDKRWKATLDKMRVVVDLGPFTELMWVDGNFAAHSGISPNYDKPKLQFGPVLQPVIDILQVLATLSGEEFDSGMNVAMSNSADNWEYKFNCAKEIPVIKFPSPEQLSLNPNPPLKLEAGLRVGFYFNEVLSIPTDLKQLVPACGAYVEFYGGLQVQCFTLGAASIYGVGRVTLGIAADSKAGISLHMKFGFGAEVVVGLPVVANVSVLYMVEVEVSISDSALDVAGLLLIRGSAEICGGLVGIAIQIEAGGSVHHDADGTTLIAQVTFSIDICLLWVIDIDVTEHWQEERQIA
ncbi:hypothetical protein [uncultured Phenylobacterium sp.]|uniref:hypothetical protein n=1 Tax=uncultured Phenylobacterium sp. TaxID=349273 RepID=UPI0025D89A83|nr:hypothetical protein [uncultured Phenylobacterium sp.]